MAIKAEYIWIDGTKPTPLLRSKTKIVPDGTTEFPEWSFDGSSTQQAVGESSDCVLKPVFTCKDPIRGGENVPVVEVEELLYRHDAIEDAAIVAMPDPRLGERGCVFVTLKSGASLSFAELQAYLQDCKLAKNYWPERLEIITEMPRTASGKIQKFELRAKAQSLAPGQ